LDLFIFINSAFPEHPIPFLIYCYNIDKELKRQVTKIKKNGGKLNVSNNFDCVSSFIDGKELEIINVDKKDSKIRKENKKRKKENESSENENKKIKKFKNN
jgi:hypothetical protein